MPKVASADTEDEEDHDQEGTGVGVHHPPNLGDVLIGVIFWFGYIRYMIAVQVVGCDANAGSENCIRIIGNRSNTEL